MQIIIPLKFLKNYFACNIVLDANHHYPGNIQSFFACKSVLDTYRHYPENIQRLFRLQDCLGRKPSLCWNLYAQRFFRLQICLRRKSSLSWKYSKTFSPARLSWPQINIILKIIKDFFACKIVLDANHHYLGNIQRLFRLQNCFRCKSSFPWNF